MNPDCFILKNFELQCGQILPIADLVYRTYGKLADDRSNVILYPTSYGAQHTDLDWLIGDDRILDPRRWFIIIVNMFGNGLSSSHSNTPECKLAEEGFWFTHLDNVRAQEQLLREVFGIDRLALVYGWSMGAQQAYHWGALYPERVQRLAAICGTAKTTPHNRIFLLSLRHALTSDPTWTGTEFKGKPERGLKTFAHIYASWAASQIFYREKTYEKLGYKSLDDYLSRFWLANYSKREPHNLLAMLDTWLRCDVSDNPSYEGDYERALRSIKARTLVMTCKTDLYFTSADCQAEAKLIPNATYQEIDSNWGHRAGNPYENPEDEEFIRKQIQKLLFLK
ncbi:MAG: Homoserine O-acetyltransferase [Chroococcopsis gigantea SAG 12.99]|jgi:homoserine O-acetyltransferase|nr:Homoserine O-acetyltransferase [Chroococcopsis gigantea SAG 12.99]